MARNWGEQLPETGLPIFPRKKHHAHQEYSPFMVAKKVMFKPANIGTPANPPADQCVPGENRVIQTYQPKNRWGGGYGGMS